MIMAAKKTLKMLEIGKKNLNKEPHIHRHVLEGNPENMICLQSQQHGNASSECVERKE